MKKKKGKKKESKEMEEFIEMGKVLAIPLAMLGGVKLLQSLNK